MSCLQPVYRADKRWLSASLLIGVETLPQKYRSRGKKNKINISTTAKPEKVRSTGNPAIPFVHQRTTVWRTNCVLGEATPHSLTHCEYRRDLSEMCPTNFNYLCVWISVRAVNKIILHLAGSYWPGFELLCLCFRRWFPTSIQSDHASGGGRWQGRSPKSNALKTNSTLSFTLMEMCFLHWNTISP